MESRPLRPSADVFHRLRWDPAFDPAQYVIGYETHEAGLKELPLLAFVPGGEIPWHRVHYFRDQAQIVWDRRTRCDRIFGSGDPGASPELPASGASLEPRFRARGSLAYDPVSRDWTQGRCPRARPGGSLKVLTLNALADPTDLKARVPHLLRALEAADADLISLQEVTRALWDALLAEDWVRRGYAVAGEGGVRLVTRLPVREVHVPADPPGERVLVATLEWDSQPVHVACVHLASDLSEGGPALRARQLAAAVEALRRGADQDARFLVGDLNSDDPAPAGATFADAWTVARPGEAGHTFEPCENPLAARTSRSGRPRRLDRVLVRGDLQVEDVGLVRTPAASDHWGVLVRLSRDPSAGALPVPTSALVLVPPPEVWEPIQELRRAHDRHHPRWMPHLTLLYGFVEEAHFEAAARRVERAVRDLAPLRLALSTFETFVHHGSTTVWLRPDAPRLVELQQALRGAFPRCDQQDRHGRFTPHLTVGDFPSPEAAQARLVEWRRRWQPLTFEVRDLCLLSRRGKAAFEVRLRVPLGPPLAEQATQTLSGLVEGMRVHVCGSHRLGVAGPESDLDLVGVVPPGTDVWTAARELASVLPGARLAEDALVPIVRGTFQGAAFDLALTGRPAGVADAAPETLSAADLERFPLGGQRSLQAVRDAAALLASAEASVGADRFRALVREVDAWTRRRMLRSQPLGLPGGIAWHVLAAAACERAGAASDLVQSFFETWAGWDWRTPVALGGVRARRLDSPWVTVLTPTAPHFDTARNLFGATETLVRAELARACDPEHRSEPVRPGDSPQRLVLRLEAGAAERPRAIGWLTSRVLGLLLELDAQTAVRPVRPYALCDGVLTVGLASPGEAAVAAAVLRLAQALGEAFPGAVLEQVAGA